MKKYAMILVALLTITLAACGKNERDIYADAGEVITDTAFNELYKQLPDREDKDNEDEVAPANLEFDEGEIYVEPEEEEEEDIEDEEYSDKDDEGEIILSEQKDTCLMYNPDYCVIPETPCDVDPADFWVYEDTFDITGFILALNGQIYWTQSYASDQYGQFTCGVNTICICLTEGRPESSLYLQDEFANYAIANSIEESSGYVTIYGYEDVLVTKEELLKFCTIAIRAANHDQGCLLRDLSLNHIEYPTGGKEISHND